MNSDSPTADGDSVIIFQKTYVFVDVPESKNTSGIAALNTLKCKIQVCAKPILKAKESRRDKRANLINTYTAQSSTKKDPSPQLPKIKAKVRLVRVAASPVVCASKNVLGSNGMDSSRDPCPYAYWALQSRSIPPHFTSTSPLSPLTSLERHAFRFR
jgi:hypothetical protein